MLLNRDKKYGKGCDPYNRAGKIVAQEDASGYQTFFYGKLGEVTKNIRTFALPNEAQPYTFAMNFEYDSWKICANRVKSKLVCFSEVQPSLREANIRMQNIVYPDSEIVSYTYNLGGMLEKVTGTKGSRTFNYVDKIKYNAFELKESVTYGNGAMTKYNYDILQRLSHLYSENGAGEAMQDIDYTYDAVSNITGIDNNAGVLSNGLGGTYSNVYGYDNLYRLETSSGQWNGSTTCSYSLNMDYLSNGRVKKKEQSSTTLLEGVLSQNSYENYYNYNSSQPNTLARINDPNSGIVQDFEWDANGNLTFHHAENPALDRRLCWDEENRLMGVADNSYTSFYQYDATGERTYKLTGEQHKQIINGQSYTYCTLDNPTLYTSPYLVATPKGYTKHYYAESERIASKIGGGGLKEICKSLNLGTDFNTDDNADESCLLDCGAFQEEISTKMEKNKKLVSKTLKCLSSDANIETDRLSILKAFADSLAPEKDIYFYHPDHLGSSSWITYTDGSSIQHLHYLPFGETQVDQRISSFGSRYTFSAKEKDEETGYSYFGARYYNSDLSIWLSVDPMSDKYPNMSPYTYCANNPMILVDPNGEDWYENESGKVVWDDNVTKKTGAPKGGTYIGAKDQDIVKYYGFNSQRQTKTTNTKGMVSMGEEGYHATQAETTTDLTINAIVGDYKNAVSGSNKQGKVFKGITITADVTTLTPGSSEGDFQVRGGLSVEYGNKIFRKGFIPDTRAQTRIPGSINQTVSISIYASQLSRNKAVGAIQTHGGYNIAGFDGQYRPMVIHGLFPYPRSFNHKF